MIDNNIILGTEEKISFDKMQIALAIRKESLEGGLQCLLLENNVIKSCENCNLKPICEGLERLTEDYLTSTTRIVSSFNFQ